MSRRWVDRRELTYWPDRRGRQEKDRRRSRSRSYKKRQNTREDNDISEDSMEDKIEQYMRRKQQERAAKRKEHEINTTLENIAKLGAQVLSSKPAAELMVQIDKLRQLLSSKQIAEPKRKTEVKINGSEPASPTAIGSPIRSEPTREARSSEPTISPAASNRTRSLEKGLSPESCIANAGKKEQDVKRDTKRNKEIRSTAKIAPSDELTARMERTDREEEPKQEKKKMDKHKKQKHKKKKHYRSPASD